MAEVRFDVFLSYSRSDKVAVELLASRLSDEAGLRPFLDSWHLVPGTPWQEAIENVLRQCEAVAVFVGPSGITPWHNEEIRASLSRVVREQNNARVIPVLLPGAHEAALPAFLGLRTYVDFRSGLDNPMAFDRLISGIRGRAPRNAETFTLPDEPAPYPNLLSFTVRQSDLFFGRTHESRKLAERVRTRPFTAVIGASGSGKSSLVRAGLLPALGSDWRWLMFVPGTEPLTALSEQLALLLPMEERRPLSQEIKQHLLDRRDGTSSFLALFLADHPEIATLLLFIDQFEEVFTQIAGAPGEVREKQDAFIANLMHAVTSLRDRVRVIITLRADFVKSCLEFADLCELLETDQFLLRPMSEDALREAIVKPAEAVGAIFEKGLVARLLTEMRRQPSALPLLQVTLARLWQERRGIWLTHTAYDDMGGVSGALDQRADAVYATLSPAQQRLMRNLFTRLVILGSDGTSSTRGRLRREQLQLVGMTPGDVEQLLALLSHRDVRLIVTEEETVELAHEALIERWGLLRSWLQEDRAALYLQGRLEEAAFEWQRHDREVSYLYGGIRLADALEWAKTHDQDRNALVRAFLEASQAQARSMEEVRLAYDRLRAEEPLARALEALVELHRRPERALLMALIASRASATAHTSKILRSLYSVFDNALIRRILRGHRDRISSVAWHADGRAVLTGSYDGTAAIWDVESGRISSRLTGHAAAVTAVAWRCTGSQLWVLTGSQDKTARIWDATTGETLLILKGHTEMVSSVAWSPDGRCVSTGSQDRTARIWDATTGEMLQKLSGHKEWVRSAEWSPDGQYILTGSYDGMARLWDVATGKVLHRLAGHTKAVPSVAWSPDGLYAATASEDGTVRIWNAAKWKTVRVVPVHTSHVYTVAWSPDGERILTGSEDGVVRVWDVATGTRLQALNGHTGWISGVAWSPDGQQVLSGSVDGTARLWDVEVGRKVYLLPHSGWVMPVAWRPDGQLVLTCEQGGILHLWDVATWKIEATYADYKAFSAAWSPDGARLLIGAWDGHVFICDAVTGHIAVEFTAHTDVVTAVQWSPGGQQVVSSSRDGSARLWDVETKANLHIFWHTTWVSAVAWSPDGQFILTGCWDNTARLWNPTTGVEVRTFTGHTASLHAVTWSPNGQHVLTSSGDGTVRIWQAATGTGVRLLEAGEVHSVAWSPDGQQILTGGQDGTVRVWDVAMGIEIRTLSQSGAVYSVAWSPGGQQILAGGEDRTARVWVANTAMIVAEVTQRVCMLFTDETIRKEWPDWQGCTREMTVVAADLQAFTDV